MAIADSRYLWAEVDRLKAQVHDLRASSRLAQEDRARTAELVASFVTRTQLDAALSTKVSQAQVEAQMDTFRAELGTRMDLKADVTALIAVQNSKLDVSVFDANVWDLQKLRTAMETHLRDLFANFASQVEHQVSCKLSVEDFIRVFNPESNGQKAELDTAASRIAKMTEQLESLNTYMNGDRQRQRQVAELNVNMLDLTRKQTAARNSIVQLQAAEESTTAQLRALDDHSHQALTNIQALTETLSGLQAQTQADKRTLDARQTRLVQNVKQLETRDQHLTQALDELQKFAHGQFSASVDAKLKANADKLHNELGEINAAYSQHAQQVKQRMNKTNDQLLQHKERLGQLDACMRKLATLLRETQGELNNVKGPLATLATNLHEENVAILQEIERSQNGTRDIMLGYQDMVEREKSTQLFTPMPSRPSSSSSEHSTVSATTSRKHKQTMLLASKAASRPQTSTPRLRAASTPNAAAVAGRQERSAGAIRTNRSPSMTPWRAQTAGAAPKVPSQLPSSANNEESEPEVRVPTAATTPQVNPRRKSGSSILQHVTDARDEDLFHFPLPDSAA